jgi:hypothetical protein
VTRTIEPGIGNHVWRIDEICRIAGRLDASLEASMMRDSTLKILIRVSVLVAMVITLWLFGLLRVGPNVLQ